MLFFIIELYFLISGFIAQICISTAELAIPTGIQTKEAKIRNGNISSDSRS